VIDNERYWQDQMELNTDDWYITFQFSLICLGLLMTASVRHRFRYSMWDHFDSERKAVASYVKANSSDVVFIPNASHGVNSVYSDLTLSHSYHQIDLWVRQVLRSLFPPSTKRNKVLYLSTAYGMVKNVLSYLTNQPILHEDTIMVNVTYPFNPQQIIRDVQAAVNKHQSNRFRTFLCLTSSPSVIDSVIGCG
jgi:hypothetical protein